MSAASQFLRVAKSSFSTANVKSATSAASGALNSATKFATDTLASPTAQKSLAAASDALGSASKMASEAATKLSSGISTQAASTKYAGTVEKALFNGRVAKELVKEVWRREQLAPPSAAQWDAARAQAVDAFHWRAIREMSLRDVGRAAVVTGEVATFFLVGEMIGRWNMVGYAV
ncbi:mitochondrial ATP synthase g subunit-domain-containing protein [Piptocephalis cylindrospora]|uniref:Mitochondrial ATP synthase g subunit-domain-containing protein n=1 Tax=Piptocephalis cylindrospora TaxID=1907219 RepID=A0A4P9XZ43_9FUNG|nr:mitochondrial ATP synthase g subunit-domain-containing protein [Piptocephalis cylindrospora]|eukprot:RKP11733.1 mitochondrial ATP synthase g subunit-domain-containing protein [Piptocephalis cylindrospora]